MKIILILFVIIQYSVNSQDFFDRFKQFGKTFKFELSNSPFPDEERMNGHTYKGEFFSFNEHYNDSSVFVFAPNEIIKEQKIDFVFYFHGWRNNIDSALKNFKLLEQIIASKKNAIFVFPEGPKNSPDSYGGKLEKENIFKELCKEIIEKLISENAISTNEIGKIILAGHSGAYRVMSFILQNGGLSDKIKEVYLFDAHYGGTEKYLNWLRQFDAKYINIYTDNGYTVEETFNFMKLLDENGLSYLLIEEEDLTSEILKKNKIIFIHSKLSHSEVVFENNQFQKFLESSLLKNIVQE